MRFLTVNLGLKLVRGEKTHNQGLNISPGSKFLDKLAISESFPSQYYSKSPSIFFL